MAITAVGAPDPDNEPEFKSMYEGYTPNIQDSNEMALIEKKKRQEKQAHARLKKTGDARHPATIRAAQRKEQRSAEQTEYEAKSSYYTNPFSRTNDEGDVINPADASACNQGTRYGSFSHGTNSCGCNGCD